MNEYQTAALSRLIIDHIRLARSRRETLGWLMASVLKAGSVNLNRLAPHIDSAAQTASVHRRLERFFDEVELNDAEVARLVVAALGLQGKPWHLALDRTNWHASLTGDREFIGNAPGSHGFKRPEYLTFCACA